MILVTVGTDLPFNRMVRIVDEWALQNGRTDVFAQIGKTDWKPSHIDYTDFIDPSEFPLRFQAATVIVAHAGMGTILSALRWGKPIIVLPRRASLGEQRNEHQLATARNLQALGKITVAFDDAELRASLDRLGDIKSLSSTGKFANPELTNCIRSFIMDSYLGS